MGKVAVVTGGSSGIGLCTARSLKEKGCTVYELSRHDGTEEFLHITADVTVCSTWFKHPFSRMVTNKVYDAYEYDLFCNNPMRAVMCLSAVSYIQTDKIRALYDTKEMVDTLLTMEYVSDDEVLKNRGEAPSVVALQEQGKKKPSNKLKVGY